MRRRAGVPVLLAGMLAVVGCSQGRSLDMDRATAKLQDSLDGSYDPPVTDLRCPDDVKAGAGRSFDCTVRIGGQPLAIRVSQVSDSGDLKVAPVAAVLTAADVEAQLVEAVKGQLGRRTVLANCRDADVRVVEPGGRFACRVSDGTSRRIVDVTVRDTAGSLSFSIRPA